MYLVFIVITIVGFNEFWHGSLRNGNFVYSIIFVCFLETLVITLIIAESIGYLAKIIITQNLFLVIGSLLTVFIVLSIIILFVGNAYYEFAPSLLYLGTITFTFLFAFIVTWYVNRIISDKVIDEFDRAGRENRINLVSVFDNMIINYSSKSTLIEHKLKPEINSQLEIIKRKIRTSSQAKIDSRTEELDEAIFKNIESINSILNLWDQHNDFTEATEKILSQLKIMKVNLSHRESLLKI